MAVFLSILENVILRYYAFHPKKKPIQTVDDFIIFCTREFFLNNLLKCCRQDERN